MGWEEKKGEMDGGGRHGLFGGWGSGRPEISPPRSFLKVGAYGRAWLLLQPGT